MRTFRLNKLVRDNLVAIMKSENQQVQFRILDERQYLLALRDKLVEESKELDIDSLGLLGELADLQEAIDCLIQATGVTPKDFREKQLGKAKRMGSLTKKIHVESVTLADDNEWVAYYAADPERFPEEVTPTDSG